MKAMTVPKLKLEVCRLKWQASDEDITEDCEHAAKVPGLDAHEMG
jgi:hypothetical protein